MRGTEKYILGSSVVIGERCLIPVVRIVSIVSHHMAFVTIGPAGIFIREDGKRYRIALEDRASWEEIGEVIPEVEGYQDIDRKNDEMEYGDQD